MATSEEARHRMYTRLEAVLGVEEAATMMEHLPPVGWSDVATKRDLDHVAALTKAVVDGLHTELKADVDGLRAEVKVGLAELETRLTNRLALQTRTLLVSNVTMLGGIVALAAILR